MQNLLLNPFVSALIASGGAVGLVHGVFALIHLLLGKLKENAEKTQSKAQEAALEVVTTVVDATEPVLESSLGKK